MAKCLWPVINVDNVEKSVEFYKAIGLKTRVEKMDIPGMPPAMMGSIASGDSGIVIWNKHIVPPDQPADTRAWVAGDLGKGVLFTIGVPNAQKLWTNAQKIRAEIDQPFEAQPWGGNGFTFVDPDGYVVNVSDKLPGPAPKKGAAKRSSKPKAKATKKVATKKRR